MKIINTIITIFTLSLCLPAQGDVLLIIDEDTGIQMFPVDAYFVPCHTYKIVCNPCNVDLVIYGGPPVSVIEITETDQPIWTFIVFTVPCYEGRQSEWTSRDISIYTTGYSGPQTWSGPVILPL